MNPFLLLRHQFLGFVHCKNKSGKSLTKARSWCWLYCVNNPVLWRPSEFPAPNPLVHTSTLLAKGTSLRKGEELLSLHEKAAKSDQEEALRWVQQTETSAFSLPLNIPFQLFIQKNYIEGNRGQVKKKSSQGYNRYRHCKHHAFRKGCESASRYLSPLCSSGVIVPQICLYISSQEGSRLSSSACLFSQNETSLIKPFPHNSFQRLAHLARNGLRIVQKNSSRPQRLFWMARELATSRRQARSVTSLLGKAGFKKGLVSPAHTNILMLA